MNSFAAESASWASEVEQVAWQLLRDGSAANPQEAQAQAETIVQRTRAAAASVAHPGAVLSKVFVAGAGGPL